MAMKKEFKYFSIFNHEKEQEYLSEMHRHGWKFVKVTGLGVYHFEECKAEEVVYQLDYNQEGIENKDEYVKMFNDCGWEYIQDYVGYSYFRKPADEMNDNEEIFCDDSSRLEMMRRVIKGRFIPCLIFLTLCLIPMFVINIVNKFYVLSVVYGIIILIYLIGVIYFGVKYMGFKRNIKK